MQMRRRRQMQVYGAKTQPDFVEYHIEAQEQFSKVPSWLGELTTGEVWKTTLRLLIFVRGKPVGRIGPQKRVRHI